jgi:hypothetical protein
MMKKALVISWVLMSLAIHGADFKSDRTRIIYDSHLAPFSGCAVIFRQGDDQERFGIVKHCQKASMFSYALDDVYWISELRDDKEHEIYRFCDQPAFVIKASREQYRDKVAEVSEELKQHKLRIALYTAHVKQLKSAKQNSRCTWLQDNCVIL